MPDLTANTHTELFLKAIAEGSTTPEGLVPENHLELWLQQIMEMGGVSGNYVRYTEQELSAAEEAQARDNIGAAGMEDLAPAYDDETAYKVGNLLTYLGKQYYCIADAPAGTLPTNTTYFEEKSVADIVEMIKNGTIVTGHSQVADNLTPYSEDSGTTQENPFISQGTGTDNNSVIVTTGNIAKQLEKQGNTVPVMQLANPANIKTSGSGTGYSWIKNQNGTVTITVSEIIATDTTIILTENTGSSYLRVPTGNKVFYTTGNSNSKILFKNGFNGLTYNRTGVLTQYASADGAILLSVELLTGLETGIYTIDPKVFNITAWNSSIITELTSHPEHFSWYYNGSLAYNAGSLQNCNGRYLECGQSRNLWNQEWENGRLSVLGNNMSGNGLRSKDYILVVPNKPLYMILGSYSGGTSMFVCYYDSTKSFVKYEEVTSNIFTPPANAIWMRFSIFTSSAVTQYNNDISIELYYTAQEGGEGYGEMHDYIAPIRIDTGDETLLGVDGSRDIKLPSGLITRVRARQALNTMTIVKVSDHLFKGTNIDPVAIEPLSAQVVKGLLAGYTASSYSVVSAGTQDKAFTYYANQLFIYDSAYNDADTFASAVADKTLEYELKEPTTEQGDSYSEYADINDYSYMAWFDSDGNLVSIPQGCKLFYPVDYKGWTDDAVMYTNGDVTSLAKNESITDAALNARGYYKMQVLLSPLTDAAGLTYDIEEAMKIGNLVSLTIRATNLEETSISSGDPLFNLASDLIPAGTIKAYANVAGSVVSCTISNLGSVSVDAAIAQNETVAIILTYAV